jgi:hypothetical protein
MSARETLTRELRTEVKQLEDDLRKRVTALPDVYSAWQGEYESARAVERTSAAWEEWVDERVTLAAVAWVLTTVFVRFCEDNALVKPVWISGPRSREALEGQQQFLRETARVNPDVTDREWLLRAVEHLKSLSSTAGLVDETSAMWLVSPSGDAATRLLDFWRKRDEKGNLLRDLSDPELDTRFLGDVYQDISEDAKKRYALLQTPVFVEEFILDRTLEPALDERPLEDFKMIDPTCGSGHFLLGGFARLLDRWHRHAPAMDERERVQAALDSIYGVDINPFAVAIARFRLTVAALRASGLTSLEDAPAFKYHLAVGDSLLHGLDQPELDLGARYSADRVAANFTYATENLQGLRSILRNGEYDCVVGNPPYITVKDKTLSELYRRNYNSCKGKYALTIPFLERFFSLASSPKASEAGWVGQITSNSFMKREFGTEVIQTFLPTVDLTHVIDSEGAWMPGHNMDGTPTVIIIGRARRPVLSTVRVALSKGLRESQQHRDGTGPYWQSIALHIDDDGFENEWVAVTQMDRSWLAKHPWSLAGGGALDILRVMEDASVTVLGHLVASIGIVSFTLEDDVYMAERRQFRTRGIPEYLLRDMVVGTSVRDWGISSETVALFPYDANLRPLDEAAVSSAARWMWPFRTNLSTSKMFSGETKVESGLKWWEYGRLTRGKLRTSLAVTFAEISPENNFALSREKVVFAQTAPVIKLDDAVTVDQYLLLLGLLNSSVACFWMRDRCKPKGGAADTAWLRTYQFNSTRLEAFPIPARATAERASRLNKCSANAIRAKSALFESVHIERSKLERVSDVVAACRCQMIAQQEELDWEVYRLYGLIDEDLTFDAENPPELALGERAFEIVLARRVAAGEDDTSWFSRHRSTPITELPTHWPTAYSELVKRRIELIESHPYIRLLERPEYKRRWATEPWAQQEERALRTWLLDRLEDRKFWFDAQGRPSPKSLAVLADEVAREKDLVSVLDLWEGRPDVPVTSGLQRLLASEAVPFLAAYRYKDTGLRKRAAWEETWRLQRLEDAGAYNPVPRNLRGDGPILVPPKYAPVDFTRSEYWSHRGKLDVPKERFILYPNAGREGDPTPVIGWAGWDHAQQSLALATLIQLGEHQGWSDERLKPLIAGLEELLPWVEQWHNQPEALYGGTSPAEFFNGLLDSYMAKIGVTRETLRAWRPEAPTRGRRVRP